MFGWFSDASSRASRSKRASRSGSLANDARQDLDRDLAAELGVAGAIDLTHPAGADHDVICTGQCAGLPGASPPVSASSTAGVSRKLFACVSDASSDSTSRRSASLPPHATARYAELQIGRQRSRVREHLFQASPVIRGERHVPPIIQPRGSGKNLRIRTARQHAHPVRPA